MCCRFRIAHLAAGGSEPRVALQGSRCAALPVRRTVQFTARNASESAAARRVIRRSGRWAICRRFPDTARGGLPVHAQARELMCDGSAAVPSTVWLPADQACSSCSVATGGVPVKRVSPSERQRVGQGSGLLKRQIRQAACAWRRNRSGRISLPTCEPSKRPSRSNAMPSGSPWHSRADGAQFDCHRRPRAMTRTRHCPRQSRDIDAHRSGGLSKIADADVGLQRIGLEVVQLVMRRHLPVQRKRRPAAADAQIATGGTARRWQPVGQCGKLETQACVGLRAAVAGDQCDCPLSCRSVPSTMLPGCRRKSALPPRARSRRRPPMRGICRFASMP